MKSLYLSYVWAHVAAFDAHSQSHKCLPFKNPIDEAIDALFRLEASRSKQLSRGVVSQASKQGMLLHPQ